MPKSNKKNAKTNTAQQAHDEQIQALAEQVAEHDDVEIVAEVDIDNKAVYDVVIIRDSNTSDDADQADNKDADKADEKQKDTEADKSADDKTSNDDKAKNDDDKADGKVDQAIDDIKQAGGTASEKVQQAAEDITQSAQDKTQELKQAVSEKADEAIEQAQALKDQAIEQVEDAQKLAGDKVDEIKEQAADAIDTAKQQASEQVDALKQQAETLKQEAAQKVDELKAQAEDKLHQAGEQANSVVDAAKQKIDEAKRAAETLKQTAYDKIDDLKQAASEKSEVIKSQVTQKVDALKSGGESLKHSTEQKADQAITDAQSAALTGSAAAYDKIEAAKDTAKDKLGQFIEQSKQVLDEKVQQLGEKYGATDTVNEIGDQVGLATQVIKDEAQSLQLTAQESLQAAKEAGAAYEATHDEKGLGATLGKLGAYLSGMYGASQSRDKRYQAVDIEKDDFEQDAFHAQSSFFAGQMFGAKAMAAQNLVGKVVPQSKFDAIGDAIYNKVAEWSSSWAINDLKKDSRYDLLQTMNGAERDAFAHDIANQNRALATLGGVAGLAGLKGVVADMAWLLMVSLRTVYQVAAIYDKPLTGKEGVKKAYGVLSGANLEKLQEKQVILTALALGSTMLANAQSTGVKAQLDSLSARYRESQPYAKQFVDLDKFIDLDKLNPKWLHKLLPISAVAVGAHYNNELIDEVIGTAMATFSDTLTEENLLTAEHNDDTDAQTEDA
ncbi:hypothetical protein B0681_06715 [Moraxella porci DSM 25326]|uniref:EcsC family protein n=1 Tax=Moraxella porci DSM 25326 TaxID=573983 RepID=A0A1T0CR77_9GAMM|nr:EcsC family protein [Moraxella porci]OOS24814.1 hypothetical protein B0681_06715 [Moraxella porci DSM 25326]